MNAICPGNIAEADMPAPDPTVNAMQRVGTPEEIASVALFLCSDAAAFRWDSSADALGFRS